jgi:hypothetical protein
MRITKLNTQLIDDDGVTPFKNASGGPLVFRDACIRSLSNVVYDPQSGKPEEDKAKLEKWDIYKLFRDSKGFVDLTIEQAALLKKWIGYWQPQLIMGQCYELLESMKDEPEKAEEKKK